MNRFVLIILLLLPFFVNAQSILSNKGDKVGDLIPEGYSLVDLTMGDLNNDSVKDLVIIIKKDEKSVLAVFIKDGYSWNKLVENSKIFQIENWDGPEFNFDSFEIKNSILEIYCFNIYLGSRYGSNYKFRLKNDNFEIIGYDEGYFHSVNHETYDYSYNFLTFKAHLSEGVMQRENGKYEITKDEWIRFDLKKNLRLDNIELSSLRDEIIRLESL